MAAKLGAAKKARKRHAARRALRADTSAGLVDHCGIPDGVICSGPRQAQGVQVPSHRQPSNVSDGSPSTTSQTPSHVIDHGEILVRPLQSLQDFRACVDLQGDVWGPEWTDTVPASLLQVATYVGGIALGAFTTAGALVGFLFGLTGVENGEVIHWSHILGVRDATRNLGVGRMLKEAQRAELARRGVNRMSWTFDPLVAKNAHLNLNRLGARVVEYVPDMYGKTTSPLHYGLATDRLVVTCDTHASPPPDQRESPPPAPVLSLDSQLDGSPFDGRALPPRLRIEIPTDIRQVIEQAPATAAAWREAVRSHFQWALSNAYEVTGLYREPVTSRSYYTLERRVA